MRPVRLGTVNRHGTATTELAVSLPILSVLAFGGINAAMLVDLKHHAKLISHSGAFFAMDTSNDLPTVITKSQSLAEGAGLKDVVVTVQRRGNGFIQVETTIAVASNSPLYQAFPLTQQVKATSITFRPDE